MEFPTESQMMSIIQKCKLRAIETAKIVGLIKKGEKLKDSMFCCNISPKDLDELDSKLSKKPHAVDHGIKRLCELQMNLASASLKFFANKFDDNSLPGTSSFVEVFDGKRRLILKKNSLCWLFGKASYKSSSDRRSCHGSSL